MRCHSIKMPACRHYNTHTAAAIHHARRFRSQNSCVEYMRSPSRTNRARALALMKHHRPSKQHHTSHTRRLLLCELSNGRITHARSRSHIERTSTHNSTLISYVYSSHNECANRRNAEMNASKRARAETRGSCMARKSYGTYNYRWRERICRWRCFRTSERVRQMDSFHCPCVVWELVEVSATV